MASKGICVLTILCALAAAAVNFASARHQHPPIDHQALFKTRVAHVNFKIGTQGAAHSNAPSNTTTSANIGGAPYNVGPVVTPTTSAPEAEEEIAVDPTNWANLISVVSDFSLRGGYNTTKFAVSFNDGAAGTWSEAFIPRISGYPATSDSQLWEANSDPTVAVDRLGNVFLCNLYLNASNNANGLYVSVGQLTDPSLGLSVGETIPVATNLDPSTTTIEDKPWLTVDNSGNSGTDGNVYVTWSHFTASSDMIMFSRSTDHGQTWSTPVQVSDPKFDGGVQGSQVAVGPKGGIYIVYETFFVGNQRQQYLVQSTDGGQSFSASVPITPLFNELTFNSTYRTNSFPSLAVSPTNGRIYVVYADEPSPTTGAEIEFVSSVNHGNNFSSPVVINDNSAGQQFFPSVVADSDGNIHVSWFDTRNGGKSSALYDIYATRSTDNGSKFAPNSRVTPVSIDAGGAIFIGDYMGLVAAGPYAHPVWTSGGFNNGFLETAALQ